MKGYQFSLRMMLAAVAVVGIGAALWVAEPSWQVGVVELLLSAWLLASVATLAALSSTFSIFMRLGRVHSLAAFAWRAGVFGFAGRQGRVGKPILATGSRGLGRACRRTRRDACRSIESAAEP